MLTLYGYIHNSSKIIRRIFQDHWVEFLSQYKDKIPEDMQPSVIEAVNKMLQFGTKEMGYAIYLCTNCRQHPEKIVFFTCKSRFCTSCGKAYVDDWVDKMSTQILDTSHRHLVFTIPEQLRAKVYWNRELLKVLSDTAAKVVMANIQDVTAGIITVVHTFGRDLGFNPHVHVLLTEGGLDDNANWVDVSFLAYSKLRKQWQYHLLTEIRKRFPERKDVSRLIYSSYVRYNKSVPLDHRRDGVKVSHLGSHSGILRVLFIDLSTPVYWRKEMIIVEKKEEIRRAYYIQDKSIRQIRRETGYHRDTIRKALGDGMKPEYKRKKAHSRPVMGPVKGIIDEWLEKDKTQPPKQRHTAKRIYERLKEEYGFGGAESTVRYYVAQRRRELGDGNDVFIPLSYAPGQIAQVDFGEAEVIISGQQLTAQVFCLRLCYSKQAFVMALPTQSQEAFFEGHVRAFDFLGGVPKQLVYDNLKAAVNKVLKGRDREEQVSFIAFRSHYLFESRFCNVAQAHEKGLVEGLVGYSRRNFFVPIPEQGSWDDLNSYLWEKCKAEGPRRLRGMQMTIGEALALEQSELLPLPSKPFPCCALHPVSTNGFGMVTFQTNRYSVPAHCAHEAIWLRAFSDRVEITNGRKILAVHTRCYGREQDILNPLHYLPLLERRPGAWDHAKPVQEWRQSWPGVYDRYLTALQEHLAVSQATREFVRVLRLHEDYSEAIITQALEKALECHCYNSDGVKQLVMCLKESLEKASPCDTPEMSMAEASIAASVVSVEPVAWPEVGQFDRLLQRNAEAKAEAEGRES